MKRLLLLFASFLVLSVTLGPATAADNRHVTKVGGIKSERSHGFKIVAEYGSGESNAEPWTTTIYANRDAIQTVYGKRGKSVKLSTRQVRQLMAALRKERFWGLANEYPIEAKDGPTLILTVTARGRSRRVTVFLPSDKPKNEEVRRFLRVWALVLTLVPSPNPGQTPAGYIQ